MTTTARPAAFDQMLQEHSVVVRRLAFRISAHETDDIAQEIMLAAVRNHESYSANYIFAKWLALMARKVRIDRHRTSLTKKRDGVNVSLDRNGAGGSEEANQHIQAELAEVLRSLSGTRGGEALVRSAMGDELSEIATDLGISKQRVHQLVNHARSALKAAA